MPVRDLARPGLAAEDQSGAEGAYDGVVTTSDVAFMPLELQSAAIFVVLVATLFFKPDGIFGKNVDRV